MSIYLPPSVLDGRRRLAGEIVQMVDTHKTLDRFNAELRDIDPYLQMVRAKEDAKPVPGIRPGYYSILRHNPGAPMSVMLVEGEHGEFVEPTAQVFETLKRNDMWGGNTPKEVRRRQERLEQAKQRQQAREREERVEEFRDRIKAIESPGVSMASAGPWRFRAGARRAR